MNPSAPDVRQTLYTALTAVFVTTLLIAEITGSKFFYIPLFRIGSLEFLTHSVGMLSFPITFLLTDMVNEYYGAQAARRMTWIGLFCAALAFSLINVSRMMPVAAESPLPQDAFERVFAMSNRLYLASLIAYVVGQLSDIAMFTLIKRVTGERLIWLRAAGSTVVSQALDSFVITSVLFYGNPGANGEVPTWGTILRIAATGYLLKFALSFALTPLVYGGRWALRRWLGLTPFVEPAASAASAAPA